jgi:hypothetical protein
MIEFQYTEQAEQVMFRTNATRIPPALTEFAVAFFSPSQYFPLHSIKYNYHPISFDADYT